jgi:hypothetical protein
MESAAGHQPRHVVVAHDQGRAARRNWLDVFRPGCGTSRAIKLRTLDRHPLASVGALVLLRCSWCPGSAPMPKLYARFSCDKLWMRPGMPSRPNSTLAPASQIWHFDCFVSPRKVNANRTACRRVR